MTSGKSILAAPQRLNTRFGGVTGAWPALGTEPMLSRNHSGSHYLGRGGRTEVQLQGRYSDRNPPSFDP